MNENHYDIDKLFQESFENNEVMPPFDMWSKIESNLPLTETDILFKEALETYEEEPKPTVWLKLKTDLPLSLRLRNGLVYLSKIAAVLLIGISVYLFFQHTNIGEKETFAEIELIEQTIDVVSEPVNINESNGLADDEILNEPIAMLEKSSNNIDDDFNPYPENSPFSNPDNVAKGGNSLMNNTFENQAAIIDVSEIARRMEEGDNSRIPSKELFKIDFIEDEEESTKVDTSLIEEEKGELRNLRHKKMYDIYYVHEDLDGKIRYPKPDVDVEIAPGLNNIPVAMNLQGEAAVNFDYNGNTAKGIIVEKKITKFKTLITKCKESISKIFNQK